MIYDYFQPMHIDLMLDELHDRFGFPQKMWKKRFDAFLLQQTRNSSELDAFMKFGHQFINPVLNAILCRDNLQSTFDKMLQYVIDKHSVPKKERSHYNK